MHPTPRWLRDVSRQLGHRSPRPAAREQQCFRPRLDACEPREATNTLLFGGLLGVGLQLPLGDATAPLPNDFRRLRVRGPGR
ncbi:MAG TPA: hypothetical protein VGF55_24360 [Gemmataceae bacterium]